MKNLFIGGTSQQRAEASKKCHDKAKKLGFNEWHEWWKSENEKSDSDSFRFICEVGNSYARLA